MRLFGLIGYPLNHSFSGDYFAQKFQDEGITDCDYRLFPLSAIEGFPQLLIHYPDLEGLNVTIPYKQAVKPYMHTIDGEAYEIGAINTIKIYQAGKDHHLKGFNTDAYGFRKSLMPLLDSWQDQALVLGSGGASRAVKYVLERFNIPYWVVSRHNNANTITYDQLSESFIQECRLIINTTPLGTHPNTDQYPPIPYSGLTPYHILYDLVYNPPLTRFLAKGQEAGATIKNGHEMLKEQAERSWAIWNNPDY